MAKVLFIVSGATYWVLKDGTRYATGYWAEEFANPYKMVTDAGHEVVVAVLRDRADGAAGRWRETATLVASRAAEHA